MADDNPFELAPEEVRRFFDEKGLKESFHWLDFSAREHAHSFTVAKSAGYDVLADIRAATKEAIDQNLRFDKFREQLEPILREKGWWGKKKIVDPKTGYLVEAQLGSLRRLKIIHWANVTTARAAGKWERIQRTKRFLPFLEYLSSTAERRRQEHTGWVGIILPVDHDWWQTHYPPNGWGCQCRVRQLSRGQAERKGYDPDASPPPIQMERWFDKRNQQWVDVPKGIGPGWQTNVGMNRMATVMESFGARLREMPQSQRRNALANYWLGNQAKAHLATRERVHMPVAVLPKLQSYMGAKLPTLSISNDTFLAKDQKHKTVSPELLARAEQLIDKGDWHEGKRPGSLEIYVNEPDQLWIFVIGKSMDGLLYLRTVFAGSRKRKRGNPIRK